MADNTKIEWADATVNAVNGCSLASPGCTNCYAMRLAGTRMKSHPTRAGLTQDSKAGPVWTGEVRLHEPALLQPLSWKRPRRIFWNAHGDPFHGAVPDEWIDRVFAVCALTPQHTHMILTKRSARMRQYLTGPHVFRVVDEIQELAASGWPRAQAQTRISSMVPLPNVWLGVSVEDQTRADERVPDLLATPAAVRFISAEPLLGPVNLSNFDCNGRGLGFYWVNALTGGHDDMCRPCAPVPKLDWVIVGGESGPGARPMHPAWARSLRDQCTNAGVAFHFKQWGEFLSQPAPGAKWSDGTPVAAEDEPVTYERVGKKAAGRLLDGIEHNGEPAHV